MAKSVVQGTKKAEFPGGRKPKATKDNVSTTIASNPERPPRSPGLLNCPICLNVYVNPRSLVCLHAFCEECMTDLTINNSEKWQETRKIECPVCEIETDVQNSSTSPSSWIKDLPLNYAIVSLLGNVNSSDIGERKCHSCAASDMVSIAEHFCVQCNHFMCADCLRNHSKSSKMRQHAVIDLDTQPEDGIPRLNMGVLEYCLIHVNKEIEFFCKDHSVLCCSTCAFVEHRNCESVVNVNDLGREIKEGKKESPALQIQNNMVTTKTHLDTIIQSLKTNCTNIGTESESIEERLQKTRLAVIHKMDKIVREVSAMRDALKKKYDDVISSKLSNSQGVHAAVVTSQAMLEFALKHGTEAQIFIAYHIVENQLKLYSSIVEEKQNSQETIGLKLKMGDVVEDLINASSCVAGVQVRHTFEKPLSSYKTQQIFSGELEAPSDTLELPYISGVTYLPSGLLMALDHKNRLCYLLNDKHIVSEALKLPSRPRSISKTGPNSVAVVLYEDKAIQIISTGKKISFRKSIKCKRTPWTTAHISDTELAVGWLTAGIGILSINDETELAYLEKDRDGRTIEIEEHDFVAVDSERLRFFQTSYNQNAMFCFEFDGKPVYCHRTRYLTKPSGVAVDRDGNAYVCSCNTAKVHQVAPDGTFITAIDLGLFHPYTISFNSSGDEMTVVNNSMNRTPRMNVIRFLPPE